MKNWFRRIVAYLKDNPEGYWFKRKLYGWGWTPVTREGWLVTLSIIGFVVLNAIRFERGGYPEEDVLLQVVLPTALAIVLLLIICLKTGEPPKWMWGPPKNNDEK